MARRPCEEGRTNHGRVSCQASAKHLSPHKSYAQLLFVAELRAELASVRYELHHLRAIDRAAGTLSSPNATLNSSSVYSLKRADRRSVSRGQAGKHLLCLRFPVLTPVVRPRADIPSPEQQLVAVHIPLTPFEDPDHCETIPCVVLTPLGAIAYRRSWPTSSAVAWRLLPRLADRWCPGGQSCDP